MIRRYWIGWLRWQEDTCRGRRGAEGRLTPLQPTVSFFWQLGETRAWLLTSSTGRPVVITPDTRYDEPDSFLVSGALAKLSSASNALRLDYAFPQSASQTLQFAKRHQAELTVAAGCAGAAALISLAYRRHRITPATIPGRMQIARLMERVPSRTGRYAAYATTLSVLYGCGFWQGRSRVMSRRGD